MRLILLSLYLVLTASVFCQGTGEVIITEYYNRPLKPTQEQLDAISTPNEVETSIGTLRFIDGAPV